MKKGFLSRLSGLGFLFLLLIALAAGLILPATSVSGQSTPASTPGASLTPAVSGEVTSIASDKTSFIIQSSNQEPVTIQVNQNTVYYKITIPESEFTSMMEMLAIILGDESFQSATMMGGMFGGLGMMPQTGSFDDIAVGDTVTVNTLIGNLASDVFILKFTNLQRVHGSITDVSAGSLTITPTAGSPVMLKWDSNTRFVIKGSISIQAGQIATALYNTQSGMAVIIAANLSSATPSPATLAPASSPAASPTSASQVSVDESSTGQAVDLSVGATLSVTLESNVSTGFSWQLVQISDPTVLSQTGNQYIAPTPSQPGTAGSEVWTFTALKTGTSAILMEYSQPWAGGIKGARTFSLTVNVR